MAETKIKTDRVNLHKGTKRDIGIAVTPDVSTFSWIFLLPNFQSLASFGDRIPTTTKWIILDQCMLLNRARGFMIPARYPTMSHFVPLCKLTHTCQYVCFIKYTYWDNQEEAYSPYHKIIQEFSQRKIGRIIFKIYLFGRCAKIPIQYFWNIIWFFHYSLKNITQT